MATTWNERSLEAVGQQAAEWFFRYREGLTATERAEFIEWLRASPLHVQEYLAMSVMAQDLTDRTVAELEIEQLLQRATYADEAQVIALHQALPSMPALRTRRTHWLALAVTIVFVALVGAGVYRYQRTDTQTYEVAGEDQGVWRLADGSVLHLNARSAARVSFDDAQRLIELRRGSGFFEVRHQTRPFTVTTAQGMVLATGTRFLVQQEQGKTSVLVLSGSVKATDKAGHYSLDLLAGHSAEMVANQPMQLTVQSEKQALAWLRREITFDSKPLTEVVAEFNRYALLPIQVRDAELSRLPISGVFNVYDAPAFVVFLRNLPGVSVQIDSQQERVLVSRQGSVAAHTATKTGAGSNTDTEKLTGKKNFG